MTTTPDRHGHLCSPWGRGGRELCGGGSSCLARVLPTANLKNDDSTVSITNNGCIRCDNRCWEHLDKMFLFFDSFPVCIGICEINLCVFLDLFQKERIDLDIYFAAVFVTQMLPCIFSWRVRFIYQHTHRTATKPKTQNIRPHPTSKHINITAAAASSVTASAPGNCRRRRSPPTEPPTTMMTMRDDHAEVPDQVAARSRE